MLTAGKLTDITIVGGIVAVLAGGCGSVVDPAAKEALFQALGNTTVTVYPTFVRAEDGSYDGESASQIGEMLTAEGLAEVTPSDAEVPITGSWGMNQAKMLQESAVDFAAHVAEHPIETEYALLAEYLILGTGIPGGIHCYIVDADGRLAFVVLLNSHWSEFSDADPQTIEDCTAVLIGVLREELRPEGDGG
jgi:hypothetical protein